MCVTIKQSKTDPFWKGIDLFIGQTGTDLCLVVALLDYLQARRNSLRPPFCFADRRLLTRQLFVVLVHDALKKAGVDQSKY